jgi:hypothetical protein
MLVNRRASLAFDVQDIVAFSFLAAKGKAISLKISPLHYERVLTQIWAHDVVVGPRCYSCW